MEIKKEKIAGLISIQPKVFGDERGFFLESYNVERYKEIIGDVTFVQDNISKSSKGVLRGLHFQKPPFDQGKLVSVLQGSVLDIAVDIRKNSPTYGQHVSVILDGIRKNQFWIPAGFAHGFCAMEDNTVFTYKCTNTYSPENEGCLLWNDTDLGINWNISEPIVSEKDKNGIAFCNFVSPF